MLKAVKNNKTLVAFEDINEIKPVDVPLSASRLFKKTLESFDAYLFSGEKLEKIRVVEG